MAAASSLRASASCLPLWGTLQDQQFKIWMDKTPDVNLAQRTIYSLVGWKIGPENRANAEESKVKRWGEGSHLLMAFSEFLGSSPEDKSTVELFLRYIYREFFALFWIQKDT